MIQNFLVTGGIYPEYFRRKRTVLVFRIRKTIGMDRPLLPLNALRAFEAAARQGSFTRAAIELCVTQAAVSHQIKGLEERLGLTLFKRTSRGLVLTDEGAALVPVLESAFDQIGAALDRLLDGHHHAVLNVGVVTTFAAGWLLERIGRFEKANPGIDLRISTNNNRVDIAGEGLDMAIRFGDGGWPGEHRTRLFEAPLTPLCDAATAERLQDPADLRSESLLRSYRGSEWESWFGLQDLVCPKLTGPVLDSSPAMADLAAAGQGVALLPSRMFERALRTGQLVRPFAAEIGTGSYWLTSLAGRPSSPAMQVFTDWIQGEVNERFP